MTLPGTRSSTTSGTTSSTSAVGTESRLEVPIVFDCEGDSLVGIVHKTEQPARIGVITIIAGGPQFRGGVGRGMVSMARDLCSNGIPVLRFDYRGMGDSSGAFAGFEDIAADLQSAVDAFLREVPELEKVVLWGGCDAASGAMIHGWKIPQVLSLVVGNPWVYTPHIEAAVRKQHYLSRLRDPSFWRKLLRFEYNLLHYAQAGFGKVAGRIAGLFNTRMNTGSATSDPADQGTFVERMLAGLQRFEGPVVFLLSGQSIVSKEFDELLASESGWAEVYRREGYKRIDFPEADQTFSTKNDREAASASVIEWVNELNIRLNA